MTSQTDSVVSQHTTAGEAARVWKLAPIEPTEKMVASGVDSDAFGGTSLIARRVREVWSAMLNASPTVVYSDTISGEVQARLSEAVMAVLEATRAYLPPDGIGKDEFINRVIGAIDNPTINPVIEEIEYALQSKDTPPMQTDPSVTVGQVDRVVTLARETLAGHPHGADMPDLALAWLANRAELHAQAVVGLASRLAAKEAATGEVDVRKFVSQIADEAVVANDVIRLKRAHNGQGRIRVATALHRIDALAKHALAALTPAPLADAASPTAAADGGGVNCPDCRGRIATACPHCGAEPVDLTPMQPIGVGREEIEAVVTAAKKVMSYRWGGKFGYLIDEDASRVALNELQSALDLIAGKAK